MYVIKARTHGCVRNDSETHSTGVTGLHSRVRWSCNPVTQSRAFHCHFAHTCAFLLYDLPWWEISYAITSSKYVFSSIHWCIQYFVPQFIWILVFSRARYGLFVAGILEKSTMWHIMLWNQREFMFFSISSTHSYDLPSHPAYMFLSEPWHRINTHCWLPLLLPARDMCRKG